MDWNLIFPLDDYVGGISRYIPLLDTPTCLNHPKQQQQQQQQQATSNKQQATNNKQQTTNNKQPHLDFYPNGQGPNNTGTKIRIY